MIGLILDFAEIILEVFLPAGASVSGHLQNRKIQRKNDAFFNFLVTLALADRNLHDKERKFLQKILNDFSFKEYSSKDVDASIRKAKERPLSIEELAKIFSKEKKGEQKAIVKFAMLFTAQDDNLSPSESDIVLKLVRNLRFTDGEFEQLINELRQQGEEKPSNPK